MRKPIDEVALKQQVAVVKGNAGFTLVELLVAIALLSVLIGIGAPNFQLVVSETKQVTLYNKVSSTLRFARSEAIKRSSAVSVCARASDITCGSDWSNGMLVFLDSAKNGARLVYDGTDSTIRPVRLPRTDITMAASALLPGDTATPAATTIIRFDERGRPNWLNGTFVFCDERGESDARALIMTGSGITRRAYSTASSNHVVIDSRGTAVSCS